MLIRLGYDIELYFPRPTPVIAVMNVHPSRREDLREPDIIEISPQTEQDRYIDSFGNICTRIAAAAGPLRLTNSTLIEDSGQSDAVDWSAPETPVSQLPAETLQFLLSSRYCEVDRISEIAWELFGTIPAGWPRAQAVCDWVHDYVTFGYAYARPTKTALDVWQERQGVCRDFQHLAITFCRALHMPARYAAGYLGDIGVPPGGPMDFAAWYEVWLGDRWWTFDARNHQPRIGRVLMARGRDAADAALTTSFGSSMLNGFSVVAEEVQPAPAEMPELHAVGS